MRGAKAPAQLGRSRLMASLLAEVQVHCSFAGSSFSMALTKQHERRRQRRISRLCKNDTSHWRPRT